MTFDPRTATQAEFEAEARRLHALRLERIRNMTPEEMQACARFMIDGYFQRAATLRVNQLWGPEDMDIQIAECVQHYRMDNFQSSAEYEAERERLVEADRARAADAAAERVRLQLREDASDAEVARARQDALRAERVEDDRRRREEPAAPQADIVVDVPDQSLHDIIVSAAKEHLNKGKWAGTLRIVGPGGDQQFDEAGNEIDADGAEAPEDELPGMIDEAIRFHRERTGLKRNIDQWQAIREAVVAGKASPGLKARVRRAAGGARRGGRFHKLWMAVRERIRSLPDG